MLKRLAYWTNDHLREATVYVTALGCEVHLAEIARPTGKVASHSKQSVHTLDEAMRIAEDYTAESVAQAV